MGLKDAFPNPFGIAKAVHYVPNTKYSMYVWNAAAEIADIVKKKQPGRICHMLNQRCVSVVVSAKAEDQVQ